MRNKEVGTVSCRVRSKKDEGLRGVKEDKVEVEGVCCNTRKKRIRKERDGKENKGKGIDQWVWFNLPSQQSECKSSHNAEEHPSRITLN